MKDAYILARALRKHSNTYYNGTPTISDDEFDHLKDQLETMDSNHPFLSEVGALPPDGWPKWPHRNLMGSLNKITLKEEFFEWAEGKGLLCLTEKYDGSTVVATYEDSKLIALATRGDGKVGEDITPNAVGIGVPNSIPNFTGEIRGEAMLKISNFEKHFKPAGYKNPRNAANGKVRDQKGCELKNHIEVFWFDILPFDRDLKSEKEKWELLAEFSLIDTYPESPYGKEVPTGCMFTNAEQVWIQFEKYKKSKRAKIDWEIDGLVIKVNDLDAQEALGVTSNRPKGAIAIKFPSIRKTTVVEDIIWQRGLTGSFCPVALVGAVDIGGVTVRRASLCGIDEINRLDIAIGDKVIISRRNDVIPKIEEVLERIAGRPTAKAPDKCNICKESLFKDGAYLLCLNSECQGEVFGNLMNWLKTLKVKGFGPSIVRGLIEEDIMTPVDLYNAPEEKMAIACNSPSNGAKRYKTLHSNKNIRLSTFLSALNIKALGNTNGQRLEKEFKTLNAVLTASIEDLQGVPGIKTNAKKISKGLVSKADLIKELRGLINIASLDTSGPLAGVSICITGDLSVPRPLIQEWIKNKGGETKSGISKTLTYLVTNTPESGTSKNNKADKYGVKKITEIDLYTLVGSKPQ